MTGFGKATGVFDNKKITVELKSLNSKQSDIIVRMPSQYKEKEMELRNLIFAQLKRGKIELSVHVENNGEVGNHSFNASLAKSYFQQLIAFSEDLNIPANDVLSTITRMPDVFQQVREELKPEEWDFLKALVGEGIEKLNQFRSDEGKKLAADFEKRINLIRDNLKVVEKFEPTRLEGIRQRIHKVLTELSGENGVDLNRQEQELIFYIEKLDITEEKVRLTAHCDYFLETMNAGNAQGKKLGFIGQEIGREINTIGSKANNAEIQRAVVQMKDELEKIKEQVLNVL